MKYYQTIITTVCVSVTLQSYVLADDTAAKTEFLQIQTTLAKTIENISSTVGKPDANLKLYRQDLEESTRILEAFSKKYPNQYSPSIKVYKGMIQMGIGKIEQLEVLQEKELTHSQEMLRENSELLQAAYAGNLEGVDNAIKQGANVNYSANDWTALMYAASLGNEALVSKLIKAGAKLEQTNSKGQTALDIAKARKLDKIVMLLNSSSRLPASGDKIQDTATIKKYGSVLTFEELNRMVHVGMAIGKKYRVNSRYFSDGPAQALKPLQDRNAEGKRTYEHLLISTGMLGQLQRGVLYDLHNNPGCFEVAMMANESLEMTDVKSGYCQ